MQGCTTYVYATFTRLYLAKDNHKVVCILQRIMQACCNNHAARLLQPRKFHMGVYFIAIHFVTDIDNYVYTLSNYDKC